MKRLRRLFVPASRGSSQLGYDFGRSGVSVLFGLIVAAIVVKGAEREQPLEFTTMIAHWANYAHEDYLPFVEESLSLIKTDAADE